MSEIDGDPSGTCGTIPIPGSDGSIARFTIEANQLVGVDGEVPALGIADADIANDVVDVLADAKRSRARMAGLEQIVGELQDGAVIQHA